MLAPQRSRNALNKGKKITGAEKEKQAVSIFKIDRGYQMVR